MPGRTAYNTRFDRFRSRERLDLSRWQKEAAIGRGQLLRYRTGAAEPRSDVLARLVRAAARLLNRPVRASELYDLGEDEPLGTPARTEGESALRKAYPTRFDQLLRRHGVADAQLVTVSRMSRQNIRKLRAGLETPRVRTIAGLVRALRRMRLDVRASDLFDVGERISFTYRSQPGTKLANDLSQY